MKFRLLIIGLLLFASAGDLFSQSRINPVADSLLRVWKNETQPDTVRLYAIHSLIWDHVLFSRPDSAFQLSILQEKLALHAGNRNYFGDAINSQGISLAIRGENERALRKFKEVLVIKSEMKDSSGIAGALNNLGNIHRDIGDLTIAADYYKNSCRIYWGMKNWQGWANAMDNLGIVSSYLGNLTGAVDYFEQAKAVRLEHNDIKGLPGSYSNLATAYNDLGISDKTIEWYNLALEMQIIQGNQKGIGNSLNNLAIQYKQRKDYSRAMEYYRKSLDVRLKVNDKNGISSTLNNIGNLYRVMNVNDSAMYYFQESLKVRMELNDKLSIAFAMNNIGSYFHDLGQYDSATVYLDKALELARSIHATSEIRRAIRYKFATNYQLGNVSEAGLNLKELLEIRQKDIDINLSLLTESDKEKYFATMASDFLVHDGFMLLHHAEKPDLIDQSYNQALQLKGLVLKSSLSLRTDILSTGDSVLIETYYSWLTVKRKISKAYSKGKPADELELQAKELEGVLVKNSIAFKQHLEGKNIDWKQVQSSLSEKDAAIEFIRISITNLKKTEDDFNGEVMYVALIVKRNLNHPVMVPLCSEKQLLSVLNRRNNSRMETINGWYGNSDANNLYNLIWHPMEAALKGVKSIYFSPDGLLHKVSFSALKNNSNKYLSSLVDLNPLFTTSSLVTHQISGQIANQDIHLFGGVEYSKSQTSPSIWPYLEGTLLEVKEIGALAGKSRKTVLSYTGTRASEENVKSCSGKKGILHVATHGFFFPEPGADTDSTIVEIDSSLVLRSSSRQMKDLFFLSSPNAMMRSGLALAGANELWSDTPIPDSEEDGILTAQEIAGLDLTGFSLVVLSACETGLGDIRGIEGVYGLRRAIKIAGVRYLIMSLWEVPDKETAEFMRLFYSNLFKTGDVRNSFKQAQQVMQKKYSPYFWAAFVLVE